jgi:hypothetical protein
MSLPVENFISSRICQIINFDFTRAIMKFHCRADSDHPELIKIGIKMSNKTNKMTEEKSGREEISSWLGHNRFFHWFVIVLEYDFDDAQISFRCQGTSVVPSWDP